MYMLCMVGSGNGASNWVEMLIGHVWGGPVVGTTFPTRVMRTYYTHFEVPFRIQIGWWNDQKRATKPTLPSYL